MEGSYGCLFLLPQQIAASFADAHKNSNPA